MRLSKFEKSILLSPLRNPMIMMVKWCTFYVKKAERISAIKYFEGKDINLQRKKQLEKLMKEAWVKYFWDFKEFFLFHFETSDEEKRKAYVPEFEKMLFCSIINENDEAQILSDKWKTYCKFKKYYRRDVCHVTSKADLYSSEFEEFATKHHDFIIKPEFSSLGRGIRVLRTSNPEDARKQMEDVFKNEPKESYIIEELIAQSASIGVFNPDSVNTLRIQTIKIDNEVRILHPMLRIGKKGSVVDNAGQGGILGLVDKSTKKICAACDKLGNQFTHHPDSNIELIGFEIPYWDEAIALAKELAMVLPGVKYTGWDLALTDNGWCMIEGNDHAQFGFQLPRQEGFRKEFDSICEELFK